MPTFSDLLVLVVLGGALLVVILVLIRRAARRTPAPNRSAVDPASASRSVVYLVAGTQLLVMQRKRKNRSRQRFEVPKGKVMRGETPLDAARRECFEESGIRPTDLQFLTAIHTRPRGKKQRSTETWHAFWGTVPAGTVVPFDHRVGGTGRDRGRVYRYQLVPLDAAVLHSPLQVPLPALQRALLQPNEH